MLRRIALTGPITVADYMAACLTEPEGTYTGHDPFGAAGDFVTAPELSQMFGELVGAALIEAWQRDGAPSPIHLVELGPGRGTLMRDALRVARAVPAFLEASEVVLVEASPRLREAQRALLAPLHPRITWADRPVAGRPIYLIANEFFDAIPIRQFVARGGRWFERTVGAVEGALAFGLSSFPTPLRTDDAPPEGAVREVRPAAEALVEEAAAHIAKEGAGAALIIDYGHTAPGYGDTLQAVRAHEKVPALYAPGVADVSAHVDFAALAAAARRGGAKVHGPVAQGPYLLALGLIERAGALGGAADEPTREAIRASVQRLAGDGPADMGVLFKVLGISASDAPLPGFPTGRPD